MTRSINTNSPVVRPFRARSNHAARTGLSRTYYHFWCNSLRYAARDRKIMAAQSGTFLWPERDEIARSYTFPLRERTVISAYKRKDDVSEIRYLRRPQTKSSRARRRRLELRDGCLKSRFCRRIVKIVTKNRGGTLGLKGLFKSRRAALDHNKVVAGRPGRPYTCVDLNPVQLDECGF